MAENAGPAVPYLINSGTMVPGSPTCRGRVRCGIFAVKHVPDEVALGGPLTKEDWYFHMARAKCWEYDHEPSHKPSPSITKLMSEVALRRMIHNITSDTSTIPHVLNQLAAFSDEVQGGFHICPTPFMWVNDADRKNYANDPAKAFSTSVDAFYKAHFHVNLVLLIPSPIQNRPRTIVVCDPNIYNRMANCTRIREVLFPRICKLLDVAELQNLPRWCNIRETPPE
ncbi:hypothetical protein B0H10DRAFT_1954420 [Mycena sp. CBHHK59/15]|nr:hypothetical protein B0H10DRAFT_1954420 [Mycena sp. CBHHK59/15]